MLDQTNEIQPSVNNTLDAQKLKQHINYNLPFW